MTTVDLLIAARAEVERGWCKDRPSDGKGNVCVMGALGRVLGIDIPTTAQAVSEAVYATDAYYALSDACLTTRGPQSYNDHPATTKADVLAMLDRAINAEAAKVSPDPAHTYAVAA